MESLKWLKTCNRMWGQARLIINLPDIVECSGGLYIPYTDGGRWGIFDQAGELIQNTVAYRGPKGEPRNQLQSYSIEKTNSFPQAPDEVYIYGGFLNPHFGHFLIESLSRMWIRLFRPNMRYKILWHGPANIPEWFKLPFITEMFKALGLGPDDFVIFRSPTHLKRLIIPLPSFKEQHFAHTVFGELCHQIGRNLTKDICLEPNTNRAYISKAALTSGVGSIINERDVVDILAQDGVDIIYPEKLTILQQVLTFAQRSNICGLAGSAMHTHALFPSSGRVSIVNATDGPNSNFNLIDLAADLKVSYYYAPASQVVDFGDKRFLTTVKLSHPELVADDILTIFRRQS